MTHYSDQKQHKQHKDQQKKNNNLETKMEKKTTTVWIFQATNKRNLTRENLEMAIRKGNLKEGNLISSHQR